MKKAALAALILLLTSLGSAEAGPINLTWDVSTESDHAGYLVSYGPSPGVYSSTIDVGDVASYPFSPPDPTLRYYLAIRAVDTGGLISTYSNEIETTPALKVTGLSANRTSPQPVGSSITFSATASGGTTPYQLKWWVNNGTTSTVGQPWSASSTFVTTPTSPSSNYTVTVWARNASSTADAPDSAAAIMSMTFVINPAGTNQAPVVNAGADQAITLPGNATMSGTVTDDGQPAPPGAVTRNWTRVSGPGTVTFSAPTAATTTATFSSAGTHVLRLTGSDSVLSVTDDVTVTVNASAGGVPLAFAQSKAAFNDASGKTLTLQLTNVKAGSLLVAYIKWEGTSASTVTLRRGTTTFTADTLNSAANNDLHGRFYYLLASTASGTVTYTATWSAARPYRKLMIYEYSYGGAVSVVASSRATATSGSLSAGSITTTGADQIVFGSYGEYNANNTTNERINGLVADQVLRASFASMWSKRISSPFTGTATATGNSSTWIGNVIAFARN